MAIKKYLSKILNKSKHSQPMPIQKSNTTPRGNRQLMLTDSILTGLLNNPQISSIFPSVKFSGNKQKTGGGCRCNRTLVDRSIIAREFISIKNQIIALSGSDLQKLKSILHTDYIVMYVPGTKGMEKKII